MNRFLSALFAFGLLISAANGPVLLAVDPPRTEGQAKGDTVHITRTGKKYHKAGCRYLRQSDFAV